MARIRMKALLSVAVIVELLSSGAAAAPYEKSVLLDWKATALTETPAGAAAADRLAAWNESTDPCEDNWPGIYCNSDRVTRISLESQELQGALPASWSSLTKLRQVSLKYNHFTGPPLPSVWTALSELALLDVGGNLLDAELPRDMSIFPALEYLYLIGNLVPGALPQSLGNLQYISLEENFLAGGLPEWSNSSVVSLKLSRNLLGGKVPSSWSTLNALTFLALNDNQLTGELPAAVLDRMSGLELLSLQDNFIAPASLADLMRVTPPEVADWTLLPQKDPRSADPALGDDSSRLFDAKDPAEPPTIVNREVLPKWAVIAISVVLVIVLLLGVAWMTLRWLRRTKRSPPITDSSASIKSDAPMEAPLPVIRRNPPEPSVEMVQPPLPVEALTDVRVALNPGDSLPQSAKPPEKHTANEQRYLRPPSANLRAPEAFVGPSDSDSGGSDSGRALLSDDANCGKPNSNVESAAVPVRVTTHDESSSPTSSSSFSTRRSVSRTSSSRRPSSTTGDDCGPLMAAARQPPPSYTTHSSAHDKLPPIASRTSAAGIALASLLAATDDDHEDSKHIIKSSTNKRRSGHRSAGFLADPSITSEPVLPSGLPGSAPESAPPPLPPLMPAHDPSRPGSPAASWAFRHRGGPMLASPSTRVASSSSLTPLRSKSAQYSRGSGVGGSGGGGLLGSLSPTAEELSPPKPGSAPGGQEGRRKAGVSRSSGPTLVLSASASAAAAYSAPLTRLSSPSGAASSSRRKLSGGPSSLVAQLRRSLSRND